MKLTSEELQFVGECLEKVAAADERREAITEALTPEERRRVVKVINKQRAEEVLPGCVYGEG